MPKSSVNHLFAQSASHSLFPQSVKLSVFQYPGLSLISRELKEHGREVLGPLGERGEGIAVTTNVFNLKVNKSLYYGWAGGGWGLLGLTNRPKNKRLLI